MTVAEPEIDELVALSAYAGRDMLLVQGCGGNTSIKSADGRRMWVKSSGSRLSEVSASTGHLCVSLADLVSMVRDPALAGLPRAAAHEESVRQVQRAALQSGPGRPSLETGFHAVLGRVVLHTHPVYLNAFACMQGGAAALAEAIATPFVWVGYAAPGFELGVAVDHACTENERHGRRGSPSANLVLANHGLISSGSSSEEVVAATELFVAAGRTFFGAIPDEAVAIVKPPEILTRLASELEQALIAAGRPLVARPAARGLLLGVGDAAPTAGALVPDDVVCSIHEIRSVTAGEITALCSDGRLATWPDRAIFWVRGHGFLIMGPGPGPVAIIEENLLANVLIHSLIARRGRPMWLPPAEIDYLAGMESERFRQAVAAGRPYHLETKGSCR